MSAGKAWRGRPARATGLPATEGLLISADGDRVVLRQDRFIVSVEVDGVMSLMPKSPGRGIRPAGDSVTNLEDVWR